MKKLLAIFALLLTLACSVVLFACEDSTKDPSTSSDTAVKITDENGVCIEGAVDPASTISISEVTNAEDLQEVQDLVELTYDNYTIQKAFQFSILLNKRTQTIDGRLDYSIPQKVLGLSWEDNNKYVFIGIKNNNATIINLVFKWPVAFFMVSSSLLIIALVNSIPLNTITISGPNILI